MKIKLTLENAMFKDEFFIKHGKITGHFHDKVLETTADMAVSFDIFIVRLMFDMIIETVECRVNGVVYWSPVEKMTPAVFKKRMEQSIKIIDQIEALLEE